MSKIGIRSIFDARVVLIILISAILLGIFGDLILTGIDKLIYPDSYRELVEKYSKEYSVPAELIFAVIKVESDFTPDAKSSQGAIGLMQVLPTTYEYVAELLGERAFTPLLYDPETNIKYGTYYLQYLYSRFGSWERALAAYNWGEGNLKNYIDENGYDDGDYTRLPSKETRNYVGRVLDYREKYAELYDQS